MSKDLLITLKKKEYEKSLEIALTAKLDFDIVDENGNTLVHLAAENAYNDVIVLLHQRGASIDVQREGGHTAFHSAAISGHVSTLRILVKLKANPLLVDKKGWTALHFAIECKKENAVSYLVQEHPGLLRIHTADNLSPLHLSVLSDSRVGLIITKLLLAAKHPVDITDQTPLYSACERGKTLQVRLLLEYVSKVLHQQLTQEQKALLEGAARRGKHLRILALLDLSNLENWPDTDSEDVSDYEYSSVHGHSSVGISFFTRSVSTFVGQLPSGQEIVFEEASIVPDGNCGFIGLGTTRQEFAALLLDHESEELRIELWQEVAGSLINNEFEAPDSERIHQEFSKGNLELLQEYCKSSVVFQAYLNAVKDESKRLFLGYYGALIFAKLKKNNLYIWRSTAEDSNELVLEKFHQEAGESQTIHLIHTAGLTHFNLLIQKSLDDVDSLGKDMAKLKVAEDKFKTPEKVKPTKTERQSIGISHFRGLHFYKHVFNRSERKSARILHQLQEKALLPRVGLFSAAARELAKLKIELIDETTDLEKFSARLKAREKLLEKAQKQVVQKMDVLQRTGPVTPCFQHTGTAGRQDFDSRYHEFVQRYVNSYVAFGQDMKEAPGKKVDGRSSARTSEKWLTLKRLGFTLLPFVSTSEESRWALEYATALINWDKKEHKLRVSEGVDPLVPTYSADGHPSYPYLGIVYVTLHA